MVQRMRLMNVLFKLALNVFISAEFVCAAFFVYNSLSTIAVIPISRADTSNMASDLRVEAQSGAPMQLLMRR